MEFTNERTAERMRDAINQIVHTSALEPVLKESRTAADAMLREALEIQAIPGPTFEEQQRADYTRRRFAEIGLVDIRQDHTGNVYGRTAGAAADSPALLVSAHLDTVFPAATDLTQTIDEQSGKVAAPGIGDNSLGLAGMLALAQAMQNATMSPATDIWWVATVGEEGLGDLRGMRSTFEALEGRVGVALILEGMGLGRVYHAGLGVRRLEVAVQGPGGHSWLHAVRPSAIHHLVRVGAALIDQATPSDEPRTSFNIGLITGGTSINTRAASASMSIDMRAEDADALAQLEARVRAGIRECNIEDGLDVSVTVIGDRPCARLESTHPLVRAAAATLEYLGRAPAELEIGSTDANIPLALGIPAICIGLTTGGNAHTIQEYILTEPLESGYRQLLVLAHLILNHIDAWSDWDALA